MKLLVFSDIHGDLQRLHELMDTEADLYVALGDLSSWGRNLDACGRVLARRTGKVLVLPGNHESEDEIAALCRAHGLETFHGRLREWNGCLLAGLGYSTPTPFDTPGEYTEEQIRTRLDAFRGRNLLALFCHCPPQGTLLDRTCSGQSIGSIAVREFIEQEQPQRFFCGHVHETAGATVRIGRTVCTNAGKQGVLESLDTI